MRIRARPLLANFWRSSAENVSKISWNVESSNDGKSFPNNQLTVKPWYHSSFARLHRQNFGPGASLVDHFFCGIPTFLLWIVIFLENGREFVILGRSGRLSLAGPSPEPLSHWINFASDYVFVHVELRLSSVQKVPQMINIFHGTTTLGLRKFLLSDVRLTGTKFSTLFVRGREKVFKILYFRRHLAIKKSAQPHMRHETLWHSSRLICGGEIFFFFFRWRKVSWIEIFFNFQCRRRRSVAWSFEQSFAINLSKHSDQQWYPKRSGLIVKPFSEINFQ